MPDQLYIGNFSKGLKLDRTPFNIDNDAFPTLFNVYSWRGRAKRKRGTKLLGRLQRQILSTATPTLTTTPWKFGPLGLVAGVRNLITGPWTTNLSSTYTLESSSSIVPGSLSLIVGANTYTEPATPDGTLIGTPAGTGTINYSTGVVTIAGDAVNPLTGTFSYFPSLPVMGLRDLVSNNLNTNVPSTFYPLPLAFDTTHSYQFNQTLMSWYNVNYYKNTNEPFVWSAPDYQLFWSTNYQSAFWAINNKPGFNFKLLTNTLAGSKSVIRVSATRVTIGLTAHGLIVGDFIFINEVVGTIGTGSGTTANQNINTQTGKVTAIPDDNTLTVDFDGSPGTSTANFQAAATGTGGIAQYLTNTIAGQDGIKWYDGDPTSATGLPTGTGRGWVNFSPPLTDSQVSIDDEIIGAYYLVGALGILPFKDRLLFFSPWIQTSSGSAINLVDTILWSWNGTPYYNALVPTSNTANETFDPRAYYVDQTGFGGYLPAGISQPITTFTPNEDVLLVGFGGTGKKTRFVYTGNDLQPFLFYLINSELPSSSTFSSITMDGGAIDLGQYGIAVTTQQSCQRLDLDIPDEVFQIQQLNNGIKRINGIRNFQKEWIYFSYPVDNGDESSEVLKFPTQSFLYNYRDNTWAIFRENFTAHGTFRRSTHYTWGTLPFPTWNTWREPWNSGVSTSLFPTIIAGNPQGYVLEKDSEGTGEGISGYIVAFADDGNGNTQVTSINHCVEKSDPEQGISGDYLYFQGPIGLVTNVIDANNFVIDIPFATTATVTNATQATQAVLTLEYDPANASFFIGQTITISGVVGMTQLNGNTYTILQVDQTNHNVTLNVDSTGFTAYVSDGTATLVSYIGLSQFTRLSRPLMQTKQFPFYWDQGRQVRLGVQKYLLDTTAEGQVTLNIYLSQDAEVSYNDPADNTSLQYSQILFTCPEDNNLQMPTAASQAQIWHRINTSLIGDTVQVGITLSDSQMRNLDLATAEIALHAVVLNVSPGPLLA